MVNVEEIMKEIKASAKKREMEDDLKRVNNINIKDMFASDESIEIEGHNIDEDLDDNINYINKHYLLSDKYSPLQSRRKVIFGFLANFVIRRVLFVTKTLIEKIITAQEAFNVRVVRILNFISKKNDKIEKDLENFTQNVEEIKKETREIERIRDNVKEEARQIEELKENIEVQFKEMERIKNEFQDEIKQRENLKIEISKDFKLVIENTKREILYPDLGIDYKGLEDRFRGDQKLILERQKQYLRFFHECKNVMDIGCGRGEFIELLHNYGSGAFGIEIDPQMIKLCREKNLNVADVDVVSYLKLQFEKNVPDKIDGIFSAQVIEHLHMDYLIEMLKLCHKILVPDKFIVLETINIKSLSTFTNSVYIDPTHVKPIHPETLKFIMESIGFRDIAFIFSAEFSPEEKLQTIEENSKSDELYNKNIKKLNELLFAPQDYAIIAKK